MAPPRIVIHVGAPKTGSTSLQRCLRAAPEVWRAHGIYVPVLAEVERQAANAKLLVVALGGEAPGLSRGFPEIDLAALDAAELLSRFLADWQREREVLLFSAENFGTAQAAALRDLLPRDVMYTVVLFVRNQFRWVESYHRQLVKLMRFERGVSELADAVLSPGPHCPDWLFRYEVWQEAFGDCRIVLFEDAVPDLLAAFAAEAGLTVPAGIPELEPQNVSPDGFQIAYLLGLGQPLELSDFMRRRRAADRAARRLSSPSLRYLSRDDEERLRARFEAGNRRLLEILGRVYDGSPLDLSEGGGDHARLHDVYGSRRYKSYRKLADSIYAMSEEACR